MFLIHVCTGMYLGRSGGCAVVTCGFSPVAPSRGDHRIPAIWTYVFLTITHVSYIMINWKGRKPNGLNSSHYTEYQY